MATRDMIKTIERGNALAKANERKDISHLEVCKLILSFEQRLKDESASMALYDTIIDAYRMGLATDPKPKKRAS